VVHAGEPQVLERQMAQLIQGRVDLDLPAADLLQQLSQMLRLNGKNLSM
jgi:hypothetical protein